jgi:hypothetical protein
MFDVLLFKMLLIFIMGGGFAILAIFIGYSFGRHSGYDMALAQEFRSLDEDECEMESNGSGCEYCSGDSHRKNKRLMENAKGDYFVAINSCNYLEDSVVGNSVYHSLIGERLNFCPICSRKLQRKNNI